MSQLAEWLSSRVFQLIHRHNLVYNCCWEDPRLDRIALGLTSTDSVAMITSAGCNALDYALDGPREIHAVDVNYRQNALLELKIAAIRRLNFEDFFELFGRGKWGKFEQEYHRSLRHLLSAPSRAYWDKRTHYFSRDGLCPATTVEVLNGLGCFRCGLVGMPAYNHLAPQSFGKPDRFVFYPLGAAQKHFTSALCSPCKIVRPVQPLKQSIGKIGAGGHGGMPINKLVKSMAVVNQNPIATSAHDELISHFHA